MQRMRAILDPYVISTGGGHRNRFLRCFFLFFFCHICERGPSLVMMLSLTFFCFPIGQGKTDKQRADFLF